jgi:hypothetical protein
MRWAYSISSNHFYLEYIEAFTGYIVDIFDSRKH